MRPFPWQLYSLVNFDLLIFCLQLILEPLVVLTLLDLVLVQTSWQTDQRCPSSCLNRTSWCLKSAWSLQKQSILCTATETRDCHRYSSHTPSCDLGTLHLSFQFWDILGRSPNLEASQLDLHLLPIDLQRTELWHFWKYCAHKEHKFADLGGAQVAWISLWVRGQLWRKWVPRYLKCELS